MAGMDSAAGGKGLVGQPVTVIRFDGEGKLTVDLKALRSVLLQKDVQKLPVVVLLVAGAFRTGKSSILNVLLRFPYLQCRDWLGEPDKPLKGFPWKSGSDAHTEGIVFWSHLFRATTADNKEVAVLLADTQGSFGTNSSTAESVHICALSVLISSIQVFNVMRNLQLDHLQHLQMYYEYGKRAQELEGGTSGFQLCVFLVRDWEWPKDYEFGWKGGEQLLQKILGEESNKNVTDELRAMRNYFESCLSSRKCFLMPSPGHTDDGCRLNGAVNGITPKFNKYLKEFVDGVLSPSKLVVKTVAGEPVTASELCKFVEKMTPMFSSEKLPKPVSMAEQTAQFCTELAREKAFKKYRDSVSEIFRSTEKLFSPEELQQKEIGIRNKVLDSFDHAPFLKLYGYHEKARKSLIKDIDTFYGDVLSKYLDAREKYEEGEKEQKNYETAAHVFGTVAAFGFLGAISVATAGLANAVLLVTSGGTVFSALTAFGTGWKARILKRKNEEVSTNSARDLAADLEEDDEESFAGECDADDLKGLIG